MARLQNFILKSSCLMASVLVILSVSWPLAASDWPQWRGPNRDGISPETGLLKEWPKEGPKLLWQIRNAGAGYAAPVVVGDRIYLLGNEGLENESVCALSTADGATVWKRRLGNVGNPKQQPNFPAARSTPTIDGDRLYALSSDGDLACLETASGKVIWQKNLRTDFEGKPGEWAYSESPLIDGERIICTPGGATATLVALHKMTGAVIWKCAQAQADSAAYASAIVVTHGGTKQYVQLVEKGMIGVEANTGKALWRFSKATSRYGANIPTPIASADYLYAAAAGTGGGAVRLIAKDGTVTIEEAYFESKLPTAIGGAIKVGDYLYGTTGQALLCVEFKTGKVKWEERALGPASLCFADDRLYLHGENGEAALAEVSAAGYREKGRFTPGNQPARKSEMEKAWAYPVVANGKLYIRDHDSLWCYAVK